MSKCSQRKRQIPQQAFTFAYLSDPAACGTVVKPTLCFFFMTLAQCVADAKAVLIEKKGLLELTLSAVPLRKTLFWKTPGVELNGSQCTV